MIINYNNHESKDWYIDRIKADKVEFTPLRGGFLIVNEGERLIPLADIISITDKAKSRKG